MDGYDAYMEQQLKIIFAILIIALGISIPIGHANAWLPSSTRYDAGYNDGFYDCGKPAVISAYQQSTAYLNHSEEYKDGYFHGATSCMTDHDYNQVYGNLHTTTVATTEQGQSNVQKVTCIHVVNCEGATNNQVQTSDQPTYNEENINNNNGY